MSAAFRGPKPGERLGRFRIESSWVSGPLGPTARARMLASDRAAVLHCLREVTPARDASEVARDIARWRGVDAPALARPLDAWTDELGAIVAVDLAPGAELPGGTLRSRARSLDVASAVALVRAAALALVPAHRAGFAHGALAPELISIETAGTVHVSGLGVAAWIGPEALLRVAGMGLGAYLAPEQIASRAASARSDVHALAAILHELLVGRPAFEADLVTALHARIAEEPAPALPGQVPGGLVPSGLRRAIAQAMSKDPAARFEDAEALATALEPFETPALRSTPGTSGAGAPATRGDDEVVWSMREASAGPTGRRSEASTRGRVGSARACRFTGALAHEQLAYARLRYGADVVERALRALDPADRDEVAAATPISWVRVEAFERFHDAFAAQLGRPVEETHPELVAGASRRTFNTLWRMLLRVGGARLVMTRAPVVYSKTYDTGVMESRDVADGGGEFVLSGWPDVPEFVLRGLRAGMSVALENVGRTGVSMSSTRTPDGAVFVARWDR